LVTKALRAYLESQVMAYKDHKVFRAAQVARVSRELAALLGLEFKETRELKVYKEGRDYKVFRELAAL
jgi:hypothetical protein